MKAVERAVGRTGGGEKGVGGVAADARAEFVAELARRAAVNGQRVVLLRQQLGIHGRNELECVVATRRRKVTQPDLAKPAASEEADDLLAIEFMPGGKGVVACRHAEMELLDAGQGLDGRIRERSSQFDSRADRAGSD